MTGLVSNGSKLRGCRRLPVDMILLNGQPDGSDRDGYTLIVELDALVNVNCFLLPGIFIVSENEGRRNEGEGYRKASSRPSRHVYLGTGG